MEWSTADLYDAHEDRLQVAEGRMISLGRLERLKGPIATLRVFEDNALVKASLQEPGRGRVLVVDGGGSLRTALLGDKLAGFALDHGWAGLVVNGCVRDSAILDAMPIAVRCIGTTPRRSAKTGAGERDVAVSFAGVTFAPGAWLYADADGIVVSAEEL